MRASASPLLPPSSTASNPRTTPAVKDRPRSATCAAAQAWRPCSVGPSTCDRQTGSGQPPARYVRRIFRSDYHTCSPPGTPDRCDARGAVNHDTASGGTARRPSLLTRATSRATPAREDVDGFARTGFGRALRRRATAPPSRRHCPSRRADRRMQPPRRRAAGFARASVPAAGAVGARAWPDGRTRDNRGPRRAHRDNSVGLTTSGLSSVDQRRQFGACRRGAARSALRHSPPSAMVCNAALAVPCVAVSASPGHRQPQAPKVRGHLQHRGAVNGLGLRQLESAAAVSVGESAKRGLANGLLASLTASGVARSSTRFKGASGRCPAAIEHHRRRDLRRSQPHRVTRQRVPVGQVAPAHEPQVGQGSQPRPRQWRDRPGRGSRPRSGCAALQNLQRLCAATR